MTDGRSITQRLKLRALGLGDIPAYVSEEYGGADKPDPTRFLAIVNDFPADHYVYVADNPGKDFFAPNDLGWLTIGVRHNGRGIHPQDTSPGGAGGPDVWVDGVERLREVVPF